MSAAIVANAVAGEDRRLAAYDEDAMREETNALEGSTLVVERQADLADLKPSLAPLVSRELREAFSDFPASLRSLAAKAEFPPLERWLLRIARAPRCELAIHQPGPRAKLAHPSPEVFLQLGGERWPIAISGGLRAIPKRCPKRLAEVFRLVGAIRMQYGASGGLIAPSSQRALPAVLEELRASATIDLEEALPGWNEDAFLKAMHANLAQAGIEKSYEDFVRGFRQSRSDQAAEIAATPTPSRPETYYTFYEDGSGNYLATNARGETWNLPMSGGDFGAGPRLDEWLADFFESGPFAAN